MMMQHLQTLDSGLSSVLTGGSARNEITDRLVARARTSGFRCVSLGTTLTTEFVEELTCAVAGTSRIRCRTPAQLVVIGEHHWRRCIVTTELPGDYSICFVTDTNGMIRAATLFRNFEAYVEPAAIHTPAESALIHWCVAKQTEAMEIVDLYCLVSCEVQQLTQMRMSLMVMVDHTAREICQFLQIMLRCSEVVESDERMDKQTIISLAKANHGELGRKLESYWKSLSFHVFRALEGGKILFYVVIMQRVPDPRMFTICGPSLLQHR